MKTFNEWLAAYTKEFGTPPAHVMAEAAWKDAFTEGYVAAAMGIPVKTGDSDLTKEPL